MARELRPLTLVPLRSSRRDAVVLGWVAVAILAYLVFLVVRPFLAPLGWAAVVAIVFRPVHVRLARSLGPARAAALTTLLVVAVVFVPLSLLASAFVTEALDAAHGLQAAIAAGRFAWIQEWLDRALERLPVKRPDLASMLLDSAQAAALAIGAYSGWILRNLVTFVFDVGVALFASFFLLRDAPAIASTIRHLAPMPDHMRDRLLAEIADLIDVSVRASIFVAALQGLLGGVVFAAVGIGAPVFWGVVMAWFCLLPFGAWVVWLPAAAYFAAAGDFVRAAIVGGLGVGVVSAVDNVLRPMLLTGRTSMNGLLVFISLLGGVAAFGVIGLVLGPVVIAAATATIGVYAESRRRTSAAGVREP